MWIQLSLQVLKSFVGNSFNSPRFTVWEKQNYQKQHGNTSWTANMSNQLSSVGNREQFKFYTPKRLYKDFFIYLLVSVQSVSEVLKDVDYLENDEKFQNVDKT